jgi:regulator of replication initiation timing
MEKSWSLDWVGGTDKWKGSGETAMNDDKYAKLRELLAKATPGPWIAVEAHEHCTFPSGVAIAVHTEAEPWLATGRICSIVGQGEGAYNPETTTANAQLTAAARNTLPALLADLDAVRRERDDIKSNVENAVRCAKEYCPDYPWTLNTASEAVWATGESYKGVSAACDDLHKDLDAATADLKAVSAALDGLAEHNVKLRTENAKLREALEHELKRLERYTDRTHIMGVECDHPACKAAERIRAALARATLEGKQ